MVLLKKKNSAVSDSVRSADYIGFPWDMFGSQNIPDRHFEVRDDKKGLGHSRCHGSIISARV